jgi:hypothetical protein
MSDKIFYIGRSAYRTFVIKDSEGMPVDHANITDIEVVLTVDEIQVMQFSKVTPKTDFAALVEESDAGTYSMKITEAESLNFPPSENGMQMEIWRKYPSTELPTEGLKLISKVQLYDKVHESEYQKNR